MNWSGAKLWSKSMTKCGHGVDDGEVYLMQRNKNTGQMGHGIKHYGIEH